MARDRRVLQASGVVALAIVVVLAGCGGSPDATETPGTEEALSNATLPPGVNDSGVHDTAALLSAHRQAMAESGFVYTFEHRRVDRFPNGTTRTAIDVSGEVRVTENLTAMREEVDRDRPDDETQSVWTNGTTGFERVVASGTTYERVSEGPTLLDTAYYRVRPLVARDGWNVSRVSDDGSRVYLVSDDQQRMVDGMPVSDKVDGQLVVDHRGRILRLNVTVRDRSWEEDLGGRVYRNQTFVYEVASVGNVSVSPPEWLDEARNGTRNH